MKVTEWKVDYITSFFYMKDLNPKLQTTKGAQDYSYADILLLEQAVEVMHTILVYFAITR